MRTDEEIVARIQQRREADAFGFEWTLYVSRLTVSVAAPFVKDNSQQWAIQPRDHESVRKQCVEYMPFAWEKANECRGISANRSIAHYQAWLWFLGEESWGDKLFDDYEHYGKPQLVRICQFLGVDHKQWDDGIRVNSEAEKTINDPGKYDAVATLALEACKAEGVVLMVYNGEHGDAFETQGPLEMQLALPMALRDSARRVELQLAAAGYAPPSIPASSTAVKPEWEYNSRYKTWVYAVGTARIEIEPRIFCDRGNFGATVSGVPDLNDRDGFPRYYMQLDRARCELQEWLDQRMAKAQRA